MPWTPLAVETDPDAATSRILDAMRVALPGWEPYEGSPEVVLAEEIGRESVVLGLTAQAVMEAAVAGIGQTVFGVPAQQAVAAAVVVRLTVGTAGVIPAGFTVLGITDTGDEVAFRLDVEQSATPPHVDVAMTAVVPGAGANSVPAGDMRIVTATAIVVSATALARAVGGVDEESRLSYLDRLTSYLATLRPGGVRGADLALLARSVVGVHRALGVDLFNPDSPGVASERSATVFLVDDDGLPVDTGVHAAVLKQLEEVREVNFDVRTGSPTYTAVDVAFDAVAEPGTSLAAVETNIVAAIAGFLSPATWGATLADDQAWVDTPTIRFLDLARVAGSATGVAYLTSLTLNGAGVDVTMTGPAPLPASTTDPTDPTTIGGTVV